MKLLSILVPVHLLDIDLHKDMSLSSKSLESYEHRRNSKSSRCEILNAYETMDKY